MVHDFRLSAAGQQVPAHGLETPCWTLTDDLDVRKRKTMHHLANFYSLITFIGPQSHLRNHGDADKVTHDYSSMVEPD